MEIKSTISIIDMAAYYEFRWRMLRAPLNQPIGSERDEFESESLHVMACGDGPGLNIIGCGRAHFVSEHKEHAQIRYVAVDPQYQGHGIGKRVLARLEEDIAFHDGIHIFLNSRADAVAFYSRSGYKVTGQAPTLYGIEHFRMEKDLLR